MTDHSAAITELQSLCDRLGWCVAIPKLRDGKLPGFVIGTEPFCDGAVRKIGWPLFDCVRAPGPNAAASIVVVRD